LRVGESFNRGKNRKDNPETETPKSKSNGTHLRNSLPPKGKSTAVFVIIKTAHVVFRRPALARLQTHRPFFPSGHPSPDDESCSLGRYQHENCRPNAGLPLSHISTLHGASCFTPSVLQIEDRLNYEIMSRDQGRMLRYWVVVR
jgi:hypothetical protein